MNLNNVMQVAYKIARFFNNSPKRQATLEIWIQDILQGEKRKKLKEMCRTRWMERHKAFELFSDLFMPIISCLEAISRSKSLEWNSDSRSDAQSFLLALSQFPFIVGLHITQAVLGSSKGLSIKLQGKYVVVACAHRDIELVKSTLLNARRNVESFHKSIYGDAKQVAATVGIDESAPRLASRQQHCTNNHADNYIQYYQRNLTIPLLDHLIVELNNRFDPVPSQHVIELMNLLPSTITSSQHHDFENVLKMYCDDLPSSKSFSSELHL